MKFAALHGLDGLNLAASALISLTTPTGHTVYINPVQISSMREPIDATGHWAAGVKCIVVMTNARLNAVADSCDTVRRKLNGEEAPCVLVCGETRARQ